jgi:hypothetical protein
MPNNHLAVYLNDHLAGATGAVELLASLAAEPGPLGPFAAALKADIAADREELLSLMRRLDVGLSTARRIGGWLSEKLAEVKVRLDDPAGGGLRLLEMLEVLALGIEGKRALWTALESVGHMNPHVARMDFDRLLRRADEQRTRVESQRLQVARSALAA